ncbi:RagB/SusD family nutrient uptake outer membrane protein [Flavobacterium sp. 140616W15]|uniref:RagB/SusD family nutrient uptake outer membrane protein n=1 Tax=Flavobacterium sp. 140616W15 TaxID=2478552 RepID=UPI000F0C5FE9|nr:RagB/SusD family nutrient uptake outer membrane protein [Flavobacterium sp. 140616W15]AYN03591.1 RagB/SusD family nutrient uptake outer membrane protein [Flavobacterium sp. 140616W15]
MKINLITSTILLSSMLSIMMLSCDSFTEVNLPKSQMTSEGVFNDYATADAALTDIYSKMRDTGILTGSSSGISIQLGNYTDELVAFGTPTSTTVSFFNNAVLPSNSNISDYWNSSYNEIYAANAVLEGTEASTVISAENKAKLQGESLFIRAFVHFYLVNLFGDVPYIKTTDYAANSFPARQTAEDVYKNITADLLSAAELLPDAYTNTERIRPNRFTVRAFLARVYLYRGLFAEASNESSAVLNQNALYSLNPNLNQVFLIGSKETIWQLKPAVAGQNTKEGITFIFLSGPPGLTSVSAELYNSFASADLRKTNWIKEVKNGNDSWYHSSKYKEQNFTAVSKEYSIIFRTAEQYLIRAEARAQQGDLIGAKEDLNKIRQRAGIQNTPALTKEEILLAVLQERKWEFFTENAHRFFDLKRSNSIDAVLSVVKPGWNRTDSLLPIPQSELSANPNLRPQNAGY